MRYTKTVEIAADPEAVWEVLLDVERWPEWTASMSSVERLDEGPLAPGSRVRIRQPGLPAALWVVETLDRPRSFSWRSKAPGVNSVADHRIQPARAGGVTVTLSVEQTGPLAGPVAAVFGRRGRRHVDTEAEGLARRLEG